MSGARRVLTEAQRQDGLNWAGAEERSLVLDLPRLGYHLLRAKGNLAEAILRWFIRLGVRTRLLRAGRLRILLSVDPSVARAVLVDHAAEFPKTSWERRVLRPAMANGLIILEGDEWKQHHRVVAGCFSPQFVARLPGIVFDATAERSDGWNGHVNISHELRCIVNQVIRRYFLDQRVGDACSPFKDIDELAMASKRSEVTLEKRVFHPTHLGEPRRGAKRLFEKIRSSIGCPVHRFSAAGDSPLRHLIGEFGDEDTVIAEIRTLTAAALTTGHLLTWVCDRISRDGRMQTRLRREILQALTERKDVRELSLAEIEAMPYLSAVIHEALRLYPPAPFLLRALSDSRDRSLVFIPIWAMHRLPEEWENPEGFVPERWLGMSRQPESFIPFGLGGRTCVGKRFSMIEARVVLIEILRRFELTASRSKPPSPIMTILTRPRKDVWLEARPAVSLSE